ncbi:hypothetical protein SO3561_09918 [Streptomyces olivochromogenes]|uniref:Uncharacterized protein n=1 Tax=Streptomyces olivochromogenes TaxID=1963 RepID=A0A250VW62_STROL|nr:hypothetical protein SO3561_09918 [Streptomyces olivochromogenes]
MRRPPGPQSWGLRWRRLEVGPDTTRGFGGPGRRPRPCETTPPCQTAPTSHTLLSHAAHWSSPSSPRPRPTSSCSGTSPAATRRAATAGWLRRPRGPPGRGRARAPGHRGHRLPRGPRRRHRRPADAAAAAPRARGRPSRPAHRAALRTGTRPGLHPPGVGQRLGSGRQHQGAGVAPPRARGSRRAARPHGDSALAGGARADRAAGAAGAPELRRDRGPAPAPRQQAADRRGGRHLPHDPADRIVYDTVLKPCGWLRRLRAGHGREGSTWYLDTGSAHRPGIPAPQSRFRTTQYPPDPAPEEWPTPETATADNDCTVIARLMGHDAFAHHGLGSSALVIIGALHIRPTQTVGELVGTASVSRATVYRTLRRLAGHGLVHHRGETWALAPRTLEGLGNSPLDAVTGPDARPAQGWDEVRPPTRHDGRRGPPQGPARGRTRGVPGGAGPARGTPQPGRGARPRRGPGPDPGTTRR